MKLNFYPINDSSANNTLDFFAHHILEFYKRKLSEQYPFINKVNILKTPDTIEELKGRHPIAEIFMDDCMCGNMIFIYTTIFDKVCKRVNYRTEQQVRTFLLYIITHELSHKLLPFPFNHDLYKSDMQYNEFIETYTDKIAMSLIDSYRHELEQIIGKINRMVIRHRKMIIVKYAMDRNLNYNLSIVERVGVK